MVVRCDRMKIARRTFLGLKSPSRATPRRPARPQRSCQPRHSHMTRHRRARHDSIRDSRIAVDSPGSRIIEHSRPESPSRPRCAQSHAAQRALAPTLAGFVLKSATSARPHSARDSRAHATPAAGEEKIERAGADAACDEIVSRKPLPKEDAIRDSRIASSPESEFPTVKGVRPCWRRRPAINDGGSGRRVT